VVPTGRWLTRGAWLDNLLSDTKSDFAFAADRFDKYPFFKPRPTREEHLAVIAPDDATTITGQINYHSLE
jgi:hypothetical protein